MIDIITVDVAMALYRRGKTWWLCYTHNGKQVRVSAHTQKKSVALELWERTAAAQLAASYTEAVEVLRIIYKQRKPSRMPLSGAYDAYTRTAAAVGKIPQSADGERRRQQRVNEFITWLKKARPTVKYLDEITGVIAADYAVHLAATGAKTKTRRNKIDDLGAVWRMLAHVVEGLANPWQGLRPADTDGERLDAFTPEQEKSVLDAAARIDGELFGMCIVARHTGLRYGDVAKLSLRTVDLDAGIISLEPHKTKRHGVRVKIPIVRELRETLRKITPDADGFFFPFHARHAGTSNSLKGRKFSDVLKAAGLYGKGNFTFHSWRHTAATRLAESGADIETRKLLLGHTVDATARRYDHHDHLAEKLSALERAAR